MKIAIVHYWFLADGGGEKVIEALAQMYPGADIYCLFADSKRLPGGISREQLQCSVLDKCPFSHRINRALFPLYSAAIGSFDFSKYDLIISSDSPPIKGIVPGIDTVHISYCHTPGRFIWDHAPAFTAKLPWFARLLFAEMASNARVSDFVAAQRVDSFIANSNYVARRIRRYYRRDSTVIYPPVDVANAFLSETHDDYYLSVGRLIKNKRIDLLIHACSRLKRRLLIAGEGRDEKALKAIAGPTIEFLGRVSKSELETLYSRCRAFIFAPDEDFGIVSVEAQAYGRPVIAFGHGGSLETVRVDDPGGRPDTGLFFPDQSTDSLVDAILRFESLEHKFVPAEIRKFATVFDSSLFKERLAAFVGTVTKDREMPTPVAMRMRARHVVAAWDETAKEPS
ncbi:MAG: glycosyltransferase [Terracidiphilus sp.]|jgi:glycosyltransferase involved in cell wall biosynthesis